MDERVWQLVLEPPDGYVIMHITTDEGGEYLRSQGWTVERVVPELRALAAEAERDELKQRLTHHPGRSQQRNAVEDLYSTLRHQHLQHRLPLNTTIIAAWSAMAEEAAAQHEDLKAKLLAAETRVEELEEYVVPRGPLSVRKRDR